MIFPGEDIIILKEHTKFFRRTKNGSRTHVNFPGARQNVLEHIKISKSALSKFCKNTNDFPGGESIIRTNLPGDLAQNYIRFSLQNFDKALLANLICSYGIYVFLRNFEKALL